MVKVVKFGGSSLASAEQFKKVGNIIREDSLFLQHRERDFQRIQKLQICFISAMQRQKQVRTLTSS